MHQANKTLCQTGRGNSVRQPYITSTPSDFLSGFSFTPWHFPRQPASDTFYCRLAAPGTPQGAKQNAGEPRNQQRYQLGLLCRSGGHRTEESLTGFARATATQGAGPPGGHNPFGGPGANPFNAYQVDTTAQFADEVVPAVPQQPAGPPGGAFAPQGAWGGAGAAGAWGGSPQQPAQGSFGPQHVNLQFTGALEALGVAGSCVAGLPMVGPYALPHGEAGPCRGLRRGDGSLDGVEQCCWRRWSW